MAVCGATAYTKGVITEQYFLLNCLERSIPVAVPVLRHNTKYDFIVYVSGGFLRVQVKTVRSVRNIYHVSSHSGVGYVGYPPDSFDFFACMLPDKHFVIIPYLFVCTLSLGRRRLDRYLDNWSFSK